MNSQLSLNIEDVRSSLAADCVTGNVTNTNIVNYSPRPKSLPIALFVIILEALMYDSLMTHTMTHNHFQNIWFTCKFLFSFKKMEN